jgi:ATP-binding cassette subfamily B protein
LPSSPRVADLGCGAGAQTLHLASLLDGSILAIDRHPPLIERLRTTLEEQGLSGRVAARVADMSALDLRPASFDLVWSEGALYNLGLETALPMCADLLRSGGYLAFTEAVWRTMDPPPEVREAFADYSTMGRVEDVVSLIEANAFSLVDHFDLPDEAWWADFYDPMEYRIEALRVKYAKDIEALSVLFQEGIINLLVQVFTLLVITGALFFYDPLLALITLAVAVPPTLAASLWFRRESSRWYLEVRDRIAALLANLQESLAGIRVIAAHNRRAVNVAGHRDVVGEHRDAAISASRANSIYAPGTEFIGICTQATLLGVGGAMVAGGRITVGEMAAFLLFLTSFFAPIQTLVQLYNSYQQGGAAIIKLRELLATEPTVAQAPGASVLPPVEGTIELHDVSLRIEPGETVAFVGETGAGKSTVAKLLARFHDPDTGTVTIDGHDLRSVDLASLRSQLGVVPQEPFLFAGVVRDNVGFARPDASDDELLAALEAVGIADLIERLGGLDAPVHERGASLSAGERQLLALARAFVAKPRLLILAEATSNLDLRSGSRVERALDVVLEGRTAVIIAHRLATARRADRIAVVHDGRIAELGSHEELVSHEGRYASMYATWVAHGGAE